MADFLPRGDDALLQWASNFVRMLRDYPERHHVHAAEMDPLEKLHRTFAETMTAAKTPDTRTRVSVAAKNAARVRLVETLRRLRGPAAQVARDESFRIALDCKPSRGGRRRPLRPPEQAPRVWIDSVRGNTVHVRITDAVGSASRRPHGAARAEMRRVVGRDWAVPDMTWDWKLAAITSRRTLTANFGPDVPPGTRVWVVVRWVSPTGQPGPWSDPVGTWTLHPHMMVA